MAKKILIGVVIIIVGAVAFMVGSTSLANKPKEPKEEVLKSKQSSPKKALIVYQPSNLNTTKAMATNIAEGLNDGGYEVVLNYPGEELSTDISGYSLIVFGSPTYAGQPVSIVSKYISKIKDFSSKKVVLFSTGSDAENTNELEVMEKELNGVKAYKKIKFAGDKKANKEKAYNLGKELAGQ